MSGVEGQVEGGCDGGEELMADGLKAVTVHIIDCGGGREEGGDSDHVMACPDALQKGIAAVLAATQQRHHLHRTARLENSCDATTRAEQQWLVWSVEYSVDRGGRGPEVDGLCY